ncbi:MAG: SpoIIE family protein phosphatase [Solirubrobacterales bacterium]
MERSITTAAGAAEPDRPTRASSSALLVGVGALGALVAADVLLDHSSSALVGLYVAAPFLTALVGGPLATLTVGLLALAAAAGSGEWNMNTGSEGYVIRLVVIGGATLFAVASSWTRERGKARAGRLSLLDAVGEVADGSLPLPETLRRVVDVLVPGVADLCMVDAIHDGRTNRLAVRARGREDAEEVERALMAQPPSLPRWLVAGDRSWRHIPRWMPRMREEDLRRMAQSPDDLEFLLSLDVRSSVTVPIAARDRNLGALTLISAWSGRRYSSDDLQFAQILASRIALALDNAGLFSDLESVERRMDSVMSILDEAVVIHGADGELVFANPAAARTLGFESSEEAVATPTESIRERFAIRDEAGSELGAEALAGRRVLERGEEAGELTLRVTERATGRERWYRTRARPVEGTDGGILFSVTAIEDVTDVKRAEFSQRLLARIGELLGHPEDYRRTFESVPDLLVPEFADWCSVNMQRDDGLIEQLAIAAGDDERRRAAIELRERYPVRIDDEAGIGAAIRNDAAQLATMSDELIEKVAVDDEHLRLMRESDAGSAIIAPMHAGGRVVGALALVNGKGSRVFDDDDLETAIELARRAGLAIENARLADERARVADALQRELLPPSLPAIPGWEIATMYEPAGEVNEVGGDFYEVFAVDGGWAVVLGDVSGRGAAAASLTAEARHTIRTAGQLAADPRAGMRLLDENLRDREDAALCSVAMLVLPESAADDDELEAAIYLAGHPPPLLLRDGRTEEVGEPGPMLGVVDDPEWPPVAVKLRRGDQLVLYTDGVIEARRSRGQRFGAERLRRHLAGSIHPDGAVASVREGLADFLSRSLEDDAALVVLGRTEGAARIEGGEAQLAAPAGPAA